MKQATLKIEKLIEEAQSNKKIFYKLSQKDTNLFPEITKLYVRNFNFRKYVPKDILDFVKNPDTCMWVIKNNDKIVGAVRIRRRKAQEDIYLKKITKKPTIIFMSDLISEYKGVGSETINFIAKLSKKKGLEFFTSAWKKELVPYYEKNGFKQVDVGNPLLHIMKYTRK